MNIAALLSKWSIRFVLAVLLTVPPPAAAQGGLTPPGVPMPSMKSLAQIEPRTPISALPITISNAGSYYFTTNLLGSTGTNGIRVIASDVTVDLGAFALMGVPGALTAVTATVSSVGLTVRNGTIRNWPGGAINALGADARFESLNMYSNGGAFALLAGVQARVRECTVAQNSAGLSVGEGSRVSDCTIRHNSGTGVTAGDAAALFNCAVYGNTGHGLSLASANTVEGCTIRTNGLNGVVGVTGVRIARCNISQNQSNGVNLTFGGHVADNTFASNRMDGIRVTARCTVVGNTVDYNGIAGNHAGIRLLSSDNRVENNHLTSNVNGIFSDVGYNVIVRNKATLNATNFVLHANDVAGPRTNSASTDLPWVNFTF